MANNNIVFASLTQPWLKEGRQRCWSSVLYSALLAFTCFSCLPIPGMANNNIVFASPTLVLGCTVLRCQFRIRWSWLVTDAYLYQGWRSKKYFFCFADPGVRKADSVFGCQFCRQPEKSLTQDDYRCNRGIGMHMILSSLLMPGSAKQKIFFSSPTLVKVIICNEPGPVTFKLTSSNCTILALGSAKKKKNLFCFANPGIGYHL